MVKGDIVRRISHNYDIIFSITNIKEGVAILQGVYVRLIADSPIDDLVLVDEKQIDDAKRSLDQYQEMLVGKYKNKMDHITGKILHFDSDSFYLEKCLEIYKKLNIYAQGVLIQEDKMELEVLKYINIYRPNIIVITGHDSYNKKGIKDLKNYTNTIHFLKTILKVRQTFSIDDICIYAGACGSNAEALIAAGANFASSFDRKNIEALDPAIVAVLAAITPFNQIVDINHIYEFSRMKKGSIGGIETYGKMRLLLR